MAGRRGLRFWLVLWLGAFVAVVALAAFIFRDDILQGLLDPKVPFVRYHPPPAPHYERRGDWAVLPATPELPLPTDPPADVFFIHPTTFDGGRDWNGPLRSKSANYILNRFMLPNYAAPFASSGRVFAPRYRQASLYTKLSFWDDAVDARRFAYGDVKAAFDFYLAHYNQGRPLVIVGVEQGGELASRLLREEVLPNPAARKALVAAYLIETIVPADEHGPKSPLPACSARGQAGCLLAWASARRNDFARAQRLLARSKVWDADDQLVDLRDRPALCVNPVLGVATDAEAPARLNLGAANATGLEWGVRPGFMVRQVAAQCEGGVLRVTRPRSSSLLPAGDWRERLRAPGYNLFWADLEADVAERLATWERRAAAVPSSPSRAGWGSRRLIGHPAPSSRT